MSEWGMLAAALIGLFGMWVGVQLERADWLISARRRDGNRTAHHCKGEFFYIVPEADFVEMNIKALRWDQRAGQEDGP